MCPAVAHPSSFGAIHKGFPHHEVGGGSPKADMVREVVWILYYKSVQNADKGGGGQKIHNICGYHIWKLPNFATVSPRLPDIYSSLVMEGKKRSLLHGGEGEGRRTRCKTVPRRRSSPFPPPPPTGNSLSDVNVIPRFVAINIYCLA